MASTDLEYCVPCCLCLCLCLARSFRFGPCLVSFAPSSALLPSCFLASAPAPAPALLLCHRFCAVFGPACIVSPLPPTYHLFWASLHTKTPPTGISSSVPSQLLNHRPSPISHLPSAHLSHLTLRCMPCAHKLAPFCLIASIFVGLDGFNLNHACAWPVPPASLPFGYPVPTYSGSLFYILHLIQHPRSCLCCLHFAQPPRRSLQHSSHARSLRRRVLCLLGLAFRSPTDSTASFTQLPSSRLLTTSTIPYDFISSRSFLRSLTYALRC